MDWVLRSPQIHSTFSNLGYVLGDGYHINENCNSALETILHNILTEDKYLRSYRRSISFGQNIKKDLIPLLVNAKEDKTIELLTRILVNLTIPIECLLSVDVISKSDFGRHTIFEINNLLASTKSAFTDNRATKVVIDFLKKNADNEQKITTLLPEQCSNISNSLLLLRNILHIPEDTVTLSLAHSGSAHSVQNQILWNIFSQSIDKVLIKLMTVPEAYNWGVTMVQFIALLYKDQHVVTLHKLLNMWLEASLSESSEDNESNTSPPDRGRLGSDDSSRMLTSEPTSDSSDTGASGNSNGGPNSINSGWEATENNGNQDNNQNSESADSNKTNVEENALAEKCSSPEENISAEKKYSVEENKSDEENNSLEKSSLSEKNVSVEKPAGKCVSAEEISSFEQTNTNQISAAENDSAASVKFDNDSAASGVNGTQSEKDDTTQNKSEKKVVISETSDCGYGTQIEKESISTSSNEDDAPSKKPVHQKPHNPKQRANTKVRSGTNLQDRKKKRIVKRGKSNIINVQGLSHKTPNDDDIAMVLKEFTVDFLLKGYNSLVETLHHEILTNTHLAIDKSHFFWLVTYFLKFATQIELDLEHVESVLSFNIVSYLTAEGVNLCEQFELAIKLDGQDLCPSIRRLHLVVTAIREFVQAVDTYKKISQTNGEDQDILVRLQVKMCEAEELRLLLLLLIRHYNPKYHSKQYLQDLIVTNHILLVFLDNVMRLPEMNCATKMVDHLRQFATPHVMYQYGLLLEDYDSNGEFVNDCVFTVMHHVGGELDSLISLFQPRILKTFTAIWKSEFEICDDWSDLVEYVINTFIKKPQSLQSSAIFRLDSESFDDDKLSKLITSDISAPAASQITLETDNKKEAMKSNASCSSNGRWTEDEISALSWTYMQCNHSTDVIGEMIKMLKEDGIVKSQNSIIRELFKQNIINKDKFDSLIKSESDRKTNNFQAKKEMRDDEISKLCEQLALDGKAKFLDWVQKVLLDTYYAKKCLDKQREAMKKDTKNDNFETFKQKENMPVVSPVSYHSLFLNESIALVPWNCEQASICKDLKFLQLLHKLGFHMPVDSGKVFIRIPNFWTADILYDVASKISPIDTSKLKFPVEELVKPILVDDELLSHVTKDKLIEPDNFYQVHKQTYTMVNFTPMPGCSYKSDASDIDNDNWLKVVQKSQEINLSICVESNSKLCEPDVVMGAAGAGRLPPPPAPGCALVLPTVMTVKQEIYTTHLIESSNLSACETASVASDLTRMYVSDEDERPEPPRRARAAASPTKRPRAAAAPY